ncbi:MAG TPA: tRNA lysidine(34) synthetase TilS [Rhodospirillaceae bacterium]|nr:tRNA lysidine(34) synthetase TilS [Alphaproteobacteria bacterium]HBH26874.1 tRNA lysidine(34) synthetase TilS [Rhodospirillaceae bacterium]
MVDLLDSCALPPPGACLAVAVSGGPDSMALAWLLRERPGLVALTVDHGLRPESGAEAERVGRWLAAWGVAHHILRADVPRPQAGLQAWARALRHRLMAALCGQRGIAHLALAHHADDQAETLVFRLAKGSGLTGLAGMRSVQAMDGLTLVRPLLAARKADLLALCAQQGVPFVRDPSNASLRFARVRLRSALEVEGGTGPRLARTAARLARADAALEAWAQEAWSARAHVEGGTTTLDLDGLPEEVRLRLLALAMGRLAPSPYGPPLEKLERLTAVLAEPAPFRRRTLAGVVVSRSPQGHAVLTRERR